MVKRYLFKRKGTNAVRILEIKNCNNACRQLLGIFGQPGI